jgi:hypothetical protein
MATLVARARRRRRVRAATLMTLACAFLAVSGIGAIAVVDWNGHDAAVNVAAPGDTQPRNEELNTNDLVEQLTAAGAQVAPDGTTPGYPLAPTAQLLCVNDTQVRVYEYDGIASRSAVSDTISADGSRVGNTASPGSFTIVEWMGPPHFYAAGQIIVLVLQDDTPLLQTLTHILGPTISPQAAQFAGARAPCGPPPP